MARVEGETDEKYQEWLDRVNGEYEKLLNEKGEGVSACQMMRALQGKFYRTITVSDLIEIYVFGPVEDDC